MWGGVHAGRFTAQGRGRGWVPAEKVEEVLHSTGKKWKRYYTAQVKRLKKM